MPLFRYKALGLNGKEIKGVIDADSLTIAKERLKKQQCFVTSLIALKNDEKEIFLSPSLLLAFTRELAQLLKAGLPLYESLVTIEEKYSRHPSHPLFLDLSDHLRRGSSLSSALKRYPKTFDRVYLSMVQVAEQSGNLPMIFEQLKEWILRQQKIKKQLFSALAYPSFLALFCSFIVFALLFFVIPSMKELFESRELHPVTSLVLSVSQFVTSHVLFLSLLLVLLILGPLILLRQQSGKRFLYRLSLQLPLVKTLQLHSALVRFCRSLSMLLKGGVPLLDALLLARNVVKSPLMEDSIAIAEKKILQGERLSRAFENLTLIPPLVFRMLSLAEETGKMGEAFFNLAEIYEEEVEKHLQQLSTFLQPVLLITLGAIVGLVVLSILLPLTDVGSFISD